MEDKTTSSADYILSPAADTAWTHRYAMVWLSPLAVIYHFGEGLKGDQFKVSREWVFRKGDFVFTLYDWKSTNLYESDLLSPEELWDCEEPIDLHIGSKPPATEQDAVDFAKWLEDKCNGLC